MVSACTYVVCSSYAHSLGVYSIPFETINFNPAEVRQPSNAIQENIVRIKADKPNIMQNKTDPMLLGNSPKASDQSTIIVTSSDTPINLDMNAFLGQTKGTKRELDIVNEVCVDGNVIDKTRSYEYYGSS